MPSSEILSTGQFWAVLKPFHCDLVILRPLRYKAGDNICQLLTAVRPVKTDKIRRIRGYCRSLQ